MDLAVVVAALVLAPLIQGGLTLSQWLRRRHAPELFWHGIGGVTVGVGMALYASRFFQASYFVTVVLANVALLTGLACLVQGVLAGGGRRPSPWLLASPGAFWCVAASLDFFQQSTAARVWLFAGLALCLTLVTSFTLARGGKQLRGHYIWLTIWRLAVVTMAIKVIGAERIAATIFDRFGGEVFYLIHIALLFITCNAMSLYLMARAHAAARQLPFTAVLAGMLEAERVEGSPQAPRSVVWSLRLDPLAGRDLPAPRQLADAGAVVAAAIAATCRPTEVVQTGSDRVLWVSEAPAVSAAQLARQLQRLPGLARFPARSMTLGCAPAHGRSLFAAAAEADRRAALFPGKHMDDATDALTPESDERDPSDSGQARTAVEIYSSRMRQHLRDLV